MEYQYNRRHASIHGLVADGAPVAIRRQKYTLKRVAKVLCDENEAGSIVGLLSRIMHNNMIRLTDRTHTLNLYVHVYAKPSTRSHNACRVSK